MITPQLTLLFLSAEGMNAVFGLCCNDLTVRRFSFKGHCLLVPVIHLHLSWFAVSPFSLTLVCHSHSALSSHLLYAKCQNIRKPHVLIRWNLQAFAWKNEYSSGLFPVSTRPSPFRLRLTIISLVSRVETKIQAFGDSSNEVKLVETLTKWDMKHDLFPSLVYFLKSCSWFLFPPMVWQLFPHWEYQVG